MSSDEYCRYEGMPGRTAPARERTQSFDRMEETDRRKKYLYQQGMGWMAPTAKQLRERAEAWGKPTSVGGRFWALVCDGGAEEEIAAVLGELFALDTPWDMPRRLTHLLRETRDLGIKRRLRYAREVAEQKIQEVLRRTSREKWE